MNERDLTFKKTIRGFADGDEGVALLVTLALIAVLLTASLELARQAGHAALLSRRNADALQAEVIALSGIEVAKLILVRDAELGDTDSLQETWADPDQISLILSLMGISPENLDLTISDELGKIQVNALLNYFPGHERNEDQALMWERFLNLMISVDKSVDERDPMEIINALKDWLDSDDDDAITGLSGAESAYYEGLTPKILCPNRPMDRIEALYMVKGVPRNLIQPKEEGSILNTLFSEKNGSMAQRVDGGELPETLNGSSQPPIVDQDPLDTLFTVYGMEREKRDTGRYSWPGRININTADTLVLAALLPVGMENQAAELASYRMEKGERDQIFTNSLDREWYKQVIELSDEDQKGFERLIRYDTFLFRVEVTAIQNEAVFSITAILRREKHKDGTWQCNIVQLIEK